MGEGGLLLTRQKVYLNGGRGSIDISIIDGNKKRLNTSIVLSQNFERGAD